IYGFRLLTVPETIVHTHVLGRTIPKNDSKCHDIGVAGPYPQKEPIEAPFATADLDQIPINTVPADTR
ncbi:MAG TPA: hypothetical protein VMX74_12500, partial [Pirellulales bacterium]|nr:hypothetical protein [Pirellulales bacterium]